MIKQFKKGERYTPNRTLSFNLYSKDINKFRLLTADEEADYARKIQSGDELALDILVRSNLRFVITVAKTFTNNSETINDLIQVGNIGLIKAARKFDQSKGFKFITYAIWYIRQSILEYNANHSRTIRLPQKKSDVAFKIYECDVRFEALHERTPNENELYNFFIKEHPKHGSVTYKAFTEIRLADTRMPSLDKKVSDEDGADTLGSLIPSRDIVDDVFIESDNKYMVSQYMKGLKPKEEFIINKFYGVNGFEKKTILSISEELSVSKQNVEQTIKKALRKMKLKNKYY